MRKNQLLTGTAKVAGNLGPAGKDGSASHCLTSKRVGLLKFGGTGERHWAGLLDKVQCRPDHVDAQILEFIDKHRAGRQSNPELGLEILSQKQRPTAIPLLHKLPQLGVKCHATKCDFEWPVVRDVRTLKGQLPLRLTQVKLKGVTSLEGIQFVFNGGACESPFINAADSEPHSPESTQQESLVHVFDVDQDRRIAAIIVTIDRHVVITGLELLYEGG